MTARPARPGTGSGALHHSTAPTGSSSCSTRWLSGPTSVANCSAGSPSSSRPPPGLPDCWAEPSDPLEASGPDALESVVATGPEPPAPAGPLAARGPAARRRRPAVRRRARTAGTLDRGGRTACIGREAEVRRRRAAVAGECLGRHRAGRRPMWVAVPIVPMCPPGRHPLQTCPIPSRRPRIHPVRPRRELSPVRSSASPTARGRPGPVPGPAEDRRP